MQKHTSLIILGLSTVLLVTCANKSISNLPAKTETTVIKTETVQTKPQEEVYFSENEIRNENKTYTPNVHTVRLYPKNWELGEPMITLGTEEQLELHWDVFDDEFTNYQYRITHCSKDWEATTLNEMEYLEGFNDNYVNYRENSFNSQQNYTHYAVMFPNEDVTLKKSGNYIVMVFPEDDEDNPIFTRRFFVSENQINVAPQIKYPTNVDERYYRQEVDFELFFNAQEVVNPYDNIHVVIEQNHRTDNTCTGLTPNFVKENQMIYNYDEENTFEGGNEFRHLDLTTRMTKTVHIREFELYNDTIHGIMLNDINRQFKKYLQFEDINGRYIVKTLDGQNYLLESQYIMVHFNLPTLERNDGDLYIYGEMSDYQLKPEFKMKFNDESKSYQANIYLKQGYYNYNYMFKSDNGSTNFESYEGTHYDTENEYIFKVYYSDPQNFYDRLMQYKVVNSRDNF